MKIIKLVFLLMVTALAANSQTKNYIDQPYIEVSGNADTLVTPNEIFIRIILSEKDTRDRVAIEELELKMLTALKTLNIDIEKDLTASDMMSNFKYYILKNRDVIKTKTYSLKVKDATTASQVFIKLEENEISNSYIERVDHTDIENLKNAMRTKAISDAKTRAIALTKSIGQTVGLAIHIVDVANNNEQLQGRARATSKLDLMYKKSKDDLPKIEFEKIKIESNINVKFVLK